MFLSLKVACSLLIFPSHVTTEFSLESLHGHLVAGELTLVENSKSRPTVLLLAGSGPNDRDGNAGSHRSNVLKQLTEKLTLAGFNTARFDKRSNVRYREAWPKDIKSLSDFQSFEGLVADGDTVLSFLSTHPDVNPAKIFLLGHSAGGLEVLHHAQKHPLAGVIFFASAGRTLDHLMMEQVALQLELGKVDKVTSQAILNSLSENLKTLKETGSPTQNIHPAIQVLFSPASLKLLASYVQIEPTPLASSLKMPAYVLNGQYDSQVHPVRDAETLYNALKGRMNTFSKLKVFAGLSHSFKPAKSTADAGIEGDIPAEVHDAIHSFIRECLKD